jgi:hypothetical protein
MSVFGTQPAFQVEGGLGEVGGAAEVAPVVLVGAEGEDFLALGGEAEVGGNDGEDAFFGEHGKEAGGDYVDAGEGEGLEGLGLGYGRSGFLAPQIRPKRRMRAALGMTSFCYLGWARGAGVELEMVVEEELAPGGAGLDGEGGEGVMVFVELEHASEVDGAEDVDVVEEEGLVETFWIFEEKPGGFFQAAAGVEEEVVFAGDFDAQVEIIFGAQVGDDLIGEVVDVDDDFGDAEGAEAGEGDFEEGAVVDFNEGFGAGVGEGFEAGAEAGG